MSIAVVIALLDEVENVEELVHRLDRALPSTDFPGRQLVFVVEGRDGSHELLRRLQGDVNGLELSYSPEPSGLGASLARGFTLVRPDVEFVVTLDADLNHQPEEIPRLLARARSSCADLVVGSRDLIASRVVGTPLWKRALSRIANRVLRFGSETKTSDKSSGFRVYRHSILERIEIRRNGFSCLADLVLQAELGGMKVIEEPIEFVHRTRGRSKLPFLATGLEYLSLIVSSLVRRASGRS